MPDNINVTTGEIVSGCHRRSEPCNELFSALAKAQGKFGGAEKSGVNPAFRSKYATLESVVEATRDGLAENGLSLIQLPGNGPDNHISVTTLLGHVSGQWLESTISVPPVKFDAQGLGSVVTYLRRYARMAICGIAPEDDDGNLAVQAPPRQDAPQSRYEARPATKAYPAVAEAGADKQLAREAYKRIAAAIVQTEEKDLHTIYDGAIDEWGLTWRADANLVALASPQGMASLQAAIAAKLNGEANA